jgi:hypothetical protein
MANENQSLREQAELQRKTLDAQRDLYREAKRKYRDEQRQERAIESSLKRTDYKRELENRIPSEISAVQREVVPSEYKKGGLVQSGKPKLARKGWK